MPALRNQRHERFCLALVEGKSADESYVLAGYKPNDGNAIRLKGNERVQARLAELQGIAQKASEVTLQSLLAELEDARERATTKDQLSSAVRAIELKGKFAGLMVQKVEVSESNAFDGCDDFESIAAAMARHEGIELSAAERIAFTKVVSEAWSAIQNYLASCKAKPVPTMTQFQRLAIERRRLRLRASNGKAENISG